MGARPATRFSAIEFFSFFGPSLRDALPRLGVGMNKDKIGLALGGGAARGWAHIGVLRALDEAGIKVGIIAGTSVGAVVGGCYAAGKLDELEAFVRMLTARSVLRYLDVDLRGGGLMSGTRLR